MTPYNPTPTRSRMMKTTAKTTRYTVRYYDGQIWCTANVSLTLRQATRVCKDLATRGPAKVTAIK